MSIRRLTLKKIQRKTKKNPLNTKTGSKKKALTKKEVFLKHFTDHIIAEKKQGNYVHGVRFMKNFKHSLYKAEQNSFLISLTRNLSNNPISVSLSTNIGKHQQPIFFANTRFLKKKVVIETLQGTQWLKEMREFERLVKVPSSRYLVREIVSQAKKNGYEQVLLLNPKNNPSYHEPYLFRAFTPELKQLQQKIAFKEATKQERAFFKEKKRELIKINQERMDKLYRNVALGEGFEKRGKYYVMDLTQKKVTKQIKK